jgi:cell wall-associated NlpC family hydrolase
MELKQRNIVQNLKNIAGKKFTWFTFLMACLTFTAFNTRPDTHEDPFGAKTAVIEEEATEATEALLSDTELTATAPESEELPAIERVSLTTTEAEPTINKISTLAAKNNNAAAKDLISYAHSLLGSPYNYGGITPSGFDCSGYVYHVFSKFDKTIERSSSAQSTQGDQIEVAEAVPGDLLFFTGTNPNIREVGHVGIVISNPGEPVSFIHSSSNGGVKISELEGYYTTRFMFAKRID